MTSHVLKFEAYHLVTRLSMLGILFVLVLLFNVDGHYVLGSQDNGTEQFPSWLKTNAKDWHDGNVNASSFVKIIQYFIQEGILQKPSTTLANNTSPQIPPWVKNDAEWWADGQIPDDDFIKEIQYLLQNNIINISSSAMTNITSQKYLAFFTPKPTSDLLAVLNKHIQSDDVAVSFRPAVLNAYPDIQRVLLGHSMDAIQQAIQTAESNLKPIEYIGYDNEANNNDLSTPPEEVQDPGHYTNLAADTVHQAGYKFACTPTKRILLQEYQQVDWTKVDLLIIQLQKSTTDEATFTDIVTKVSTYAKGQNPELVIFVQVNPAFDTNEHIAKMISSVSSKIDGTSIVVTGTTTPDTVDALLSGLGR